MRFGPLLLCAFAYADAWTGLSVEAPLIKIQVQYTDISNRLMIDNY